MNLKRPILFFLIFLSFYARSSDRVLIINQEEHRYELRPYLEEWQGDEWIKNTPPGITEGSENYTSLGINDAREGIRWYKCKVDLHEYLEPLVIMLEGANYYSDLKLFYQDNRGSWISKSASYDQPLSDRYIPYGSLCVPIDNELAGAKELYLRIDSKFWSIQELIILTDTGLRNYRSRTNAVLLIVGTLIFVIFLASLLIGVAYKSKLSLAFSAYAVFTFVALIMEMGILTELFASDNPSIVFTFSRSIYALFIISYCVYAYLLFSEVKMSKALKIAFRILIIFSLLFGILSLLPNHFPLIQNSLVYLLQYYGFAVFVWGIYLNRKNVQEIQFFVIGSFLVILTLLISDLHYRNYIFWPASTYLFFGSFVLEIILVGIGTFLIAKKRNTEFINAKVTNSQLSRNVAELQSRVTQSVNAYESLANHRTNANINAPQAYFENPLSKRELEVVLLLAQELNNAQISEALHVSRNTTKTHLKKIYAKLEVGDRKEAVVRAKEYGLI